MATRKAAEADIYVANSSGFIRVDGVVHRYIKGQTRVRAGHPLLRAAPKRFSPLEVTYDVEAATAAPGEKRGE